MNRSTKQGSKAEGELREAVASAVEARVTKPNSRMYFRDSKWFNCDKKGHIAKICRSPKKEKEKSKKNSAKKKGEHWNGVMSETYAVGEKAVSQAA